MNKKYRKPVVFAAVVVVVLVSIIGLTIVIASILGLRHGGSNGNGVAASAASAILPTYPDGVAEYSVEQAPDHIGEEAVVKGTIYKVTVTKSGVAFMDFCEHSRTCPFSAVIFASEAAHFPHVADYHGPVRIHGIIRSYKGRAEIVLDSPDQLVF